MKIPGLRKKGLYHERKKNILLVDDDADFIEANRIVLEKAGYDVITAFSAKEGIERAFECLPDLIILDVMMERMTDGFFVTYDLRKNEETKNIPILMLTSVNETVPYEFEPDEQYLPVDRFIEKPVTPRQLSEAVSEMLAEEKMHER